MDSSVRPVALSNLLFVASFKVIRYLVHHLVTSSKVTSGFVQVFVLWRTSLFKSPASMSQPASVLKWVKLKQQTASTKILISSFLCNCELVVGNLRKCNVSCSLDVCECKDALVPAPNDCLFLHLWAGSSMQMSCGSSSCCFYHS